MQYKYKYLDAHTHLMNYTGEGIAPTAHEAALAMQARGMAAWAMSVDVQDYRQATRDRAGCPLVPLAFGVHPWRAHTVANDLSSLDEGLESCWMVGEIGLDGRWAQAQYRHTQLPVLRYQLAAAKRRGVPVNLHGNGAEVELLAELRRARLDAPMVLHWFDGPLALLREFLALGCTCTVSCNVGEDAHAALLCRHIPLDRLLCETDGPVSIGWVRLRAMQAQDYDVANIRRVYRMAAAVRGLPPEELRKAVNDNAARIWV